MTNEERFYAGIGARDLPAKALYEIDFLAKLLCSHHFVLRSGGAMGADQAFEETVERECGIKEIFLPWRGFNDYDSGTHWNEKKCIGIAEQFHTEWRHQTRKIQVSCARNVAQILGPDPGISTPTEFVLCWAEGSVITDGRIVDCSGGTGHAVRIAAMNDIPVFNIKETWSRGKFNKYLERFT